jgi:hypothetical protein
MMKDLQPHYHLYFLLMVYPWMLTLNINHHYHFLMSMMSMMIATVTMTVLAPLQLFLAVLGLGYSMDLLVGHMDINKQLQVITLSKEFTMTSSLVSLECHFLISVTYILLLGQKCDHAGVNIAVNSPPPPPPPRESDHGPDNWTPYAGRVEFELADFIYRQNQMSASDIDTLLNLWGASAAMNGGSAPFRNHKDLYSTIDATPLGDVPWQSFSLHFNGDLPEGQVPSWKEAGYDIWFHDPRELIC